MSETLRQASGPRTRRLPAVFVYVDGPDVPSRSWETLSTRLRERIPEWIDVAPRRLAVLPTASTPDPMDAAIAGTRSLVSGLQDPGLPMLSELRLLILPGAVEGTEPRFRPLPSLLDPADDPPRLEAEPGIYLTGRAAQATRGDWQLAAAPAWRTGRGPVIPLFRVVGRRSENPEPWHNPSLFGKPVPYRPRPRIEESLRNALLERGLRVSGPLGTGKSRAVHRALTASAQRFAWAIAGRRGLGLAEQWLDRVLELTSFQGATSVRERLAGNPDPAERERLAAGYLLQLVDRSGSASAPLTLVADDWHRAGEGDRRLVARLTADLGSKSRPVLVARPPERWPEGWTAPLVRVGAWSEEELARHAPSLVESLELPDEVRDRFLAAAAGNPLLLEEGLVSLIHRRKLRRVYGSFFFAGEADLAWEPSAHLAGHVLGEADRLGIPNVLGLLAAAGRPIPGEAVRTAAEELELDEEPGWEARSEAVGWVSRRETPWGPGLGISVPGIETTIALSLPAETATLLRAAVGRAVRSREPQTAGHWDTYDLVRGTEEAAEVLLGAIPRGTGTGERDPKEVLAALQGELAALRSRGADSELELQLLWPLLPLAHRLGRLPEVERELARAQELCAGVPEKEIAVATLQAELAETGGKPREAEPHLRRALELSVRHRHRSKALLTLQLGRLLAREERYEEARRLLEQLLPELEKGGAESYAATCRFHLGNVALHERRFEDALRLHHRALDDRRALGQDGPIRASLCALGTTAIQMGDYRQALAHFESARETLPAEAKESQDRSIVLLGLGTARFRLGRYSEATVPLREAARLRSLRDSHLGEALCETVLAELFLELHQLGPADEAARRALFRLSLLEQAIARGDAERVLGRVLIRQGEHEAARQHLREAEAIHRRHGRSTEVIEDLGWMLVEALDRSDREDVEVLVRRLDEALQEGPYPARGEIADYQTFAALEWLEAQGSRVPSPPVKFLRRAYRELMRKTAYLDPDQRPHFLMQIEPHREIVNAATRHGLSMPVFV